MRKRISSKPIVCNEELVYDAPEMISESLGISRSFEKQPFPLAVAATIADKGPASFDDCAICLFPLNRACVQIKKCRHCFHDDCIKACLTHDPKCPICREFAVSPQGHCPSGSMRIHLTHSDCPGFKPSTKAIQIDYAIPRGIQSSFHENPGATYSATRRTAFLPNNDEGVQLLDRLKYAWMHGMTFSIGTSLTTGWRNSVVWTSIHHKTNLDGRPHGFPDPNYIDNCNAELTALGVPPGDANAFMRDETLEYTAPVTLSSQCAIADALEPMETGQVAMSEIQANVSPSAPMWYLDDCPVCSKMLCCEPCVQIKECFHFVHESCMADCLKRDRKCPHCDEPQGKSPSGTMAITLTQKDCPGFSAKAIEIVYRIPHGIQLGYHENPGVPYDQTVRTAYLPHTSEGCQILKRFKYAWLHGLTFTIGTSLTTKKPDSVVWATIPHKTSLLKGPFGFPDNAYLEECNGKLDELGVPKADDCP